MTVHMIRLFISQDADDALVQETTGFIETWLNNHAAWEEGSQAPNEPPSLREPIEGEPFYAADWRFEWSESKSVLLDNLWGHVEPRAPWARLGYHECTHDEEPTQHEATDSFVAELDKTYDLSHDRITPHSETVHDGSGSTVIPEVEYQMDYANGEITVGPLDGMESGTRYYIDYEYTEGGGSCSWDERRQDGPVPSHVPTVQP